MKIQKLIDAITEVSEAVLRNTTLEQIALKNIEYTIEWFQHEAELLEMQITLIEHLHERKNNQKR